VDDLAVAVAAARAGAAAVRSRFGRGLEADFKGAVDPVTAADRAAEAAVFEILGRHRPADAILSEEAGEAGGAAPGRRWVVDPLDGTVNFLHSVPHCAVSVALEDEAGPVAGAIVDVLRGEEFTALRGGGARVNGRPLAVSAQGDLRRALLSTGFPYDRHRHAADYTGAVTAALTASQGIRRSGAACLDLAWVAAGRYEGHWEFGLKPWDVAAGILLVLEAGGRATDSYGGPPRPEDLVASNGLLHEALLALVAAHRPAHRSR
jgi:myo-inositol-1(or 4)-monophosphatase